MQDDAYLSLKELARLLGMDRSHARRYVLKLGVTFHRRRTADSANQLTLAVTRDEAEGILAQRRDQGFLGSGPVLLADVGVFYVIQVVPELDPRRVKLGFAGDLADRLIQHRTAAPTASVLKAWPCRRSWETTAMDALTASGCRFILNEVSSARTSTTFFAAATRSTPFYPSRSRKCRSQKRRPITRPGPNRALQRTRLRSPLSFFR